MMRCCFIVLCLLTTAPALACRCAERDLAEYFSAADHAAVGRLTGSQTVDTESGVRHLLLEMELLTPPHKPVNPTGPVTGDRRTYRTTASSASCGVIAEPGAVYLLFARRDINDGALAVDTCSGTRIHLPAAGGEAAGFRDVPPRFVMQQLNGLAGMEVLTDLAGTQPDGNDPDNDTLIGLLDIESLSHAGFARVHAEPEQDSAVIAEFSSYESVLSREVGYESPAAVVHARSGGWYRLRLTDGRWGWLAPEYAGGWYPYDELPVRRLAYLRSPWHGFVWPGPGAGLPARARPGADTELPVEVHESRRIGGSLWFRIGLLETDPCYGDGQADTGLTGWIPAYGLSGQPAVWFFSRGC